MDIFPNGTLGSSRLLSTNPVNAYAANNGATVGVLMSYGRNEMYFETTECLADVTAPACPSASASFDGTKVNVTWSASSDAESGIQQYYVYRDGLILAQQNASTTSFDDFGFVAGATYDYEVRAMNGAYLESSGCTVHQIVIPAGNAPTGLSNNTAADVDACADTGVLVTWAQDAGNWNDGGSGTRTYDVLRDGSPVATALAYGTTQYTDTIGVNGTTYTYTVKYNNGAGFSATTSPGAAASDIVSVAPSGLVDPGAGDADACTDDDVVITWNQDPGNWGDNANGTRTYDVLRDGSPIATGLAYGTTQFTDTTGVNGTTYDYSIQYNNGCGQSSTTGVTSAADNVGVAPSGLANNNAMDLDSGLDTGVQITWSQDPADWGDSGSGTRTYDVLRDGSPIATGLAYGTTQFTDTTGTNGTTYTYTVRYNNGCALSATTSPGADAADLVGVSPPTGLSNNSAVDNDDCADTGVLVSWSQDPSAWNDGGSGTRTYDVLRDASPIQTGIAYATTSYVDTTGTNATSYTYTVRYNNGLGGSATTTPGAAAADLVSVAPSGFVAPNAFDIDACADTGIRVTWAPPSDWGDNGVGTRTYDVRRTDGIGVALSVSEATLLFDDTTAAAGFPYSYFIKYRNGCGQTVDTPDSPTATQNVASTPSGLTNNGAADLSPSADTGVQITWAQDPSGWGDSGSGTRTYDVLRDGSPISSGLAYGTTQFTDTTGVNGTTYTYTVRYNNGCGLNATTTPGATAADDVVSPPSGLTNNGAADVSVCADTGVQVTWAQDPSAWNDGGIGTRTYDVLRDGSPVATALAYGTTNFTDTTGINGTSYTYTVRYNNGIGQSATTSPGAAAADIVSVAPSGLTNNSAADVDACTDTGVLITWSQDPSNWGDNGNGTRTYDVLRNGSPVATGLSYGTTQFTDLTGTNGVSYAYTVRYNNGCGLNAATGGVSAADNIPVTEIATQATSPITIANGNVNSDLNPAFTIAGGLTTSATITWTLTGTTNITACSQVALRSPSGVNLILKSYSQPDPGAANVTAFYQTHGPGTYKIFLIEKVSCQNSSSTDTASVSATQVVVNRTCP